MSSKPVSTRRVAPDIQKISVLLKGTRPEMVFDALGFKSRAETAIETAKDWRDLCQIGTNERLSSKEKKLYSDKERGFLVPFFNNIDALEKLIDAELIAEVDGTKFRATDWSNLKTDRAIEIINDPMCRPQNLQDAKAQLRVWRSNDKVRAELHKLIDRYTLEAVTKDLDLSLDDLEVLYKESHSADVKMVIVRVMLPHATDLWRAQKILRLTGNLQAHSLAEKYLVEELSKSDLRMKAKIATDLTDQELKYTAYKDLHKSYLENGMLVEAELVENWVEKECGQRHTSRHLSAARIAKFDEINLDKVTDDLDLNSLIRIKNSAPYPSDTWREANRLVLLKLDEKARRINSLDEWDQFSQGYRHLFDDTVRLSLRMRLQPIVEEMLRLAVTVDDYVAIWNKLEHEIQRLMFKRFVLLLAPLVLMPEPTYTIEIEE